MALSIYYLIEVIILVANALAVLNNARFLVPLGLTPTDSFGGTQNVSNKIGSLITSVHIVLHIPLIFVNVAWIAITFIMG
mmetsp:Transcript_21/g.29  ORF Transcript_21/g.29 Transcript_21/m.29 type:complete len:80 (-) Transcript_21:62-301(-)